MKKFQISMDETLFKKVDEYAKNAGLSRSGFLSLAASDYISAKEKAPKISEAFLEMAKLIDSRTKGDITKDEMEKQLDELGKSMNDLGGK